MQTKECQVSLCLLASTVLPSLSVLKLECGLSPAALTDPQASPTVLFICPRGISLQNEHVSIATQSTERHSPGAFLDYARSHESPCKTQVKAALHSRMRKWLAWAAPWCLCRPDPNLLPGHYYWIWCSALPKKRSMPCQMRRNLPQQEQVSLL